MADWKKQEELQLNDKIKLNKDGKPILGRLYGPCADIISPTRNGRMYDEKLWDKVFENPIVKEYFECGGIPGELDHPEDRLETCSEKIAIMMPEPPKKNDKGELIGYWDILDTPNGRIAYTLAKYGYKLGISSRGGGDTYTGSDGKEHVDEDTYDFQGFDLVLLPAVKAARLKMVESLQQDTSFKKAINEALEKANDDEKKIMTETLNNLNIEYNRESVIDKSVNEDNIAANNIGANMVKDLQESLQRQNELEAKITELQEKLSVCYAKEAKYEDDIAKYKGAIRNLSESANNAKALTMKIENLQTELKTKSDEVNLLNEKKDKLIQKQNLALIENKNKLTESITAKNEQLDRANEQIKSLNERLNIYKQNESTLNEKLAETKKNLAIKTNEYSTKLDNANKLVEQYRRTAKTAVNKYIESKALMLGVTTSEITNKLSENYSFSDIDNVCENLSAYKVKIGKLPFNVEKGVKNITITEAKKPQTTNQINDDSIDDSLIRLAKLN